MVDHSLTNPVQYYQEHSWSLSSWPWTGGRCWSRAWLILSIPRPISPSIAFRRWGWRSFCWRETTRRPRPPSPRRRESLWSTPRSWPGTKWSRSRASRSEATAWPWSGTGSMTATPLPRRTSGSHSGPGPPGHVYNLVGIPIAAGLFSPGDFGVCGGNVLAGLLSVCTEDTKKVCLKLSVTL